MNNIALITARSGSKSIKNKNIYSLLGKKLIEYPINIAKQSEKISKIFVDTDGEDIAKIAKKNNCEVLIRPNKLRGDNISHSEVIRNSLITIEKKFIDINIVTVLLGNSVMFDSAIINYSIGFLEKNAKYDSVMSVWESGDDHPYRAMKIKNNKLISFTKLKNISTNRQSYPKAYFYDQGPWVFRKKNIYKNQGPGPWDWMGKNCYPIIRNWVTGRDIHTHLDIEISKFWLKNSNKLKKL